MAYSDRHNRRYMRKERSWAGYMDARILNRLLRLDGTNFRRLDAGEFSCSWKFLATLLRMNLTNRNVTSQYELGTAKKSVTLPSLSSSGKKNRTLYGGKESVIEVSNQENL
ncbi:hypothetical protein EAG_01525 [Camponotus floridanus]|uniref:Uncharacterized protein n=1 Tax=Camponotus floridanus TaxID=104421 RepID=E2AZA0_CAMFO|nr:hypothetical protein EAG_01525 [Camponotus floridanus]